jgi:hypothetical protein
VTCARPGCGNPIERAATGRPRRYCSERCKPGRRKLPDGLTAAELGRRTAPVALAARAKPLNGDLLAPFADAGLVERHGRSWVLVPDEAIRAAFRPDPERRIPIDADDLDLPKRGPAPGTPRPKAGA